MTELPSLTVIVPVFNAITWLDGALAQLMALQGDDLDILVVDDGSNDGTGPALALWPARDPRIRVLALDRPSGVSVARAHGVANATGDWIGYLDIDDEWPPDGLHRMLVAAAASGADVVVGAARYVDGKHPDRSRPMPHPRESGSISGAQALQHLHYGELRGHLWNKLFRASLVRSVDQPLMRIYDDLSTTLQALSRAETVYVLPDVVYRYRLHSASLINREGDRLQPLLELARTHRRERERTGRSRSDRYFELRYILFPTLTEDAAAVPAGTFRVKDVLVLLVPRFDVRRTLMLVAVLLLPRRHQVLWNALDAGARWGIWLRVRLR